MERAHLTTIESETQKTVLGKDYAAAGVMLASTELLDPALKPRRSDRGIVAELEESRAGVVVEGAVGE
ncbi:MAG: hypothetical protein ABR925_02405 [Acidimicrobiales bacterium]